MFRFNPAVECLVCVHQGKVRDTFAIPDHPGLLLVVATNRVSTHNIVHKSLIPRKGETLTELTVFWMKEVLKIRTHLVASGQEISDYLPAHLTYPTDLHSRALIVRELEMIPVEFIFRSRLAGSLWKDSYLKGLPNPYGLDLPREMQLMSPFEETLFTPTDKSDTDQPLKAQEVIQQHREAYQLALEAYEAGRQFALGRGIEIIDGKFEIGIDEDGNFVLADECLTPDSCRFVGANSITVGQEPAWLDKQSLREKAEFMWAGGERAPLTFSRSVIARTTYQYRQIARKLTGEEKSLAK